MPDLFSGLDPSRGRHNEQSRAAHAVAAPHKGSVKAEIIAWLRRRGRGTCEEFCVESDRAVNAVSGRFFELKRDGLIRATEALGETSSGCKATVYEAC